MDLVFQKLPAQSTVREYRPLCQKSKSGLRIRQTLAFHETKILVFCGIFHSGDLPVDPK